MVSPLQIRPISPDDVSLAELREEAARQGFGFLDRLVRDWADGANRFDGSGENLLGAFMGERLVGVGRLNHEPYDPAPRRARLRHLYVLQAFRRRGIARQLLSRLLDDAGAAFDEMRLRTDTVEAAMFYQRLGFEPVPLQTATHVKHLRGEATHP
jgi:GNAT superfamily N-acetyltransferase